MMSYNPSLEYEFVKHIKKFGDGDTIHYRINIEVYETEMEWSSSYDFSCVINCDDNIIFKRNIIENDCIDGKVRDILFGVCDDLEMIVDKHHVGDFKSGTVDE